MGLISSVFDRAEARSGGSATLASPAAWLLNVFGGGTTRAGVSINEATALGISAVWAAVRCISEDVAKVPLEVLEVIGPSERRPVPGHALHYLLNIAPSEEMSAVNFRETLTAHALTVGNGYAEIERTEAGGPWALHPLAPRGVIPRRVYDLPEQPAGRIVYDVWNARTQRFSTLPAEDVLHVRGLGYDGLLGYSVIALARQSLGLTLAAELFGAAFFGNSARPSGILKTKGKLKDEARDRLRDSFASLYSRAENAAKVPVLEDDVEWIQTQITPDDAQFLMTRQFQIPEIARWFRIPPHKIADLSRATFSNIEQSSIDYVGDSLAGWFTRWEQELAMKLLPYRSQGRVCLEHDEAELRRGDLKSRYDAYAQGRQWGWLSVNDVLRAEGRNTIGPAGDKYMVPVNMQEADKLGVAPAEKPAATPPAGAVLPEPGAKDAKRSAVAQAVVATWQPLLTQAARGLLRVEADRVRRAERQGGVAKWAEGFYPDHLDHVRGAFMPAAEALAGVLDVAAGVKLEVPRLAGELARRHVERSRAEAAGQPADKAELLAQGWERTRADVQAAEDVKYLQGLVAQAA
jgi:HK97 family phage portal protein